MSQFAVSFAVSDTPKPPSSEPPGSPDGLRHPPSPSSVRRRSGLGALLGQRYRVESLLGEGGTATVHLARDLETSELVVVKRMKPSVAVEPELRRRFVQEGIALARISHPHVVRALGVEEPEGEPPLLILEALGGETLGELLRRQEICPLELTLPLIDQAAVALEAVHAAGLIHRDIKPDNLFLLGPIGAPTSLKVLDFGMARFADEHADEHSTSILGTAQYMAPEQILVEPVDERTDVYALGVVMFRMVTGHLPFDARDKKDLLRHQLFSPVPPVTWLVDGLPEGLSALVRCATQKAPSRRPKDMAELRRLLSAIDPKHIQEGGAESVDWSDYAEDVYEPTTERGRNAAEVLAREFGAYSRPHHPVPSKDDGSRPDARGGPVPPDTQSPSG